MNVIVFALNDCPVAALGPYGNEWIGTTHLDRFAAEGIVFDSHISDCPDPIAARRAWRTARHQFPSLAATDESINSKDLLASLTANGIWAVLVRNSRDDISRFPDFYDGWSERFDAPPDPADSSPTEALLHGLSEAVDRLPVDTPWLLWIEIDRLSPPWTVPQAVFEAYIEDLLEEDQDEATDLASIDPWVSPPSGWFDANDAPSWELLQRSFAAAVTAFDAALGQVFDLLRERGLDQSAWILTSDRGQPFGEHGLIGAFRPWLHEELVHLPLMVRLPNAEQAGRRVSNLTQPADLLPTIQSLLGQNLAGDLKIQGFDLVPLLRGQAGSLREFACTELVIGPASEAAIRTPRWAYLLPTRVHPDDEPRLPMLYAKPDDRWEVNDLRQRNLEEADELDHRLRESLNLSGPELPSR